MNLIMSNNDLAIIKANVFSVISLLLTIAVGVCASLFPNDIINNRSPFWEVSEVSFKASAFWFLVVLATIFYTIGQVVQTKRADESLGKLDSMIKRLQTLPSDDYLPSYQSCYRTAAANTFLVLQSPDTKIGDINQTIRIVLGAILETARDFDKAGEIMYSANIMLWRPNQRDIEASSPVDLFRTNGNPDFLGILELVPELSTTTSSKSDTYDIDENIKEILLPIPKESSKIYDASGHLKEQMLPGAPYAFVYRVFASYKNINFLFNWLDNKCALDLSTINKVKDYFRDPKGHGKNILSFGSIPILSPSLKANESNDTPPLGVLNIHSAEENLLQDNGQTLFAPLLEPFLILLSVLILKRGELLTNDSI